MNPVWQFLPSLLLSSKTAKVCELPGFPSLCGLGTGGSYSVFQGRCGRGSLVDTGVHSMVGFWSDLSSLLRSSLGPTAQGEVQLTLAYCGQVWCCLWGLCLGWGPCPGWGQHAGIAQVGGMWSLCSGGLSPRCVGDSHSRVRIVFIDGWGVSSLLEILTG